jgi:hypothetical protein
MTDNKIQHVVKVNAYSGYKANERPVNFTINNNIIKIVEIMKRWVEPGKDCFKIKGDDGKIYYLYWIKEKDVWKAIENY